MATSLQQGIDAAKAGKLNLALEHFKNAIVEEPKNPDVWVWLAGIIDDVDKQTIFLKKALELDPDNRPAQRGLAYLKRQKYVPSQEPIASSEAIPPNISNTTDDTPEEIDPAYLTANVESFAKQVEALGDPQAPTQEELIIEAKSKTLKPKKPWLEIFIYGFTLIVFAIIGVLIGLTIKNRDHNLSLPTPTVSPILGEPDEGVFLYVNMQYYKLELSHNEPSDDSILLSTSNPQPIIITNSTILKASRLNIVDEFGGIHDYTLEKIDDNKNRLSLDHQLNPGRYCLVHPLSEGELSLYWCFKITD